MWSGLSLCIFLIALAAATLAMSRASAASFVLRAAQATPTDRFNLLTPDAWAGRQPRERAVMLVLSEPPLAVVYARLRATPHVDVSDIANITAAHANRIRQQQNAALAALERLRIPYLLISRASVTANTLTLRLDSSAIPLLRTIPDVRDIVFGTPESRDPPPIITEATAEAAKE